MKKSLIVNLGISIATMCGGMIAGCGNIDFVIDHPNVKTEGEQDCGDDW